MTMRATWLRGMLQVAVLSAVLMHMPQAMAALTVEIVKPDGDPFSAYVGRSAEFLAIAYLDDQELDSDLLSWNWNFGDGGTATLNPTAHAYSATGDYLVTVTASYAGQSAQAQAKTAHVVPNTTEKTTIGVEVHPNAVPNVTRVLARRTDGLKIWSMEKVNDVCVFPCGLLPVGTYELCIGGILQGAYADCGKTVTIVEIPWGDEIGWLGGSLPYIVREGDGHWSDSGFRNNGGATGTVREFIDMNPVLAGAEILATGYSMGDCQDTSAADGTYTVAAATSGGYVEIVAQKAGHQPVNTFGGSNAYWSWNNGKLDFTLPIGATTGAYGRLIGKITNYSADEGHQIRIDILWFDSFTNQGKAEFSLVKPAGDCESTASVGPFYIGDRNKYDYALYLEPHGPVHYTVPALDSHTQNWTIEGPYGLVWGCAKASGVGRPDASVSFFTDDPYMSGGRSTDESGYYAFRLIPGTYHRKVWDGSSYHNLGDVTVQAGTTQRVDFEW